jgi:hypothetical protein
VINPVPASSPVGNPDVRSGDPPERSAEPLRHPTDEWLDAGLGALTLGNEILRLRRWLATERLSAELKSGCKKSSMPLADFSLNPQQRGAEVKDRMEQIIPLDPGARRAGASRIWARVLGALAEIDVLSGPESATHEGRKIHLKLCSRKSISTASLSRLLPGICSSHCSSLSRCAMLFDRYAIQRWVWHRPLFDIRFHYYSFTHRFDVLAKG